MASSPLRALRGVRVLSLAINLPGPAALMRCRAMGATCVKIEPPQGDQLQQFDAGAYAAMHQGVRVLRADLKTAGGQKTLQRELARADVLITSVRPSALVKLGLTWKTLHRQHPALSHVAIVGAHGPDAEIPGHDLTYMAENGLVIGLEQPPTLYADMGGSLMASEAVLQALLQRQAKGQGVFVEVALSAAAGYLALPHAWGLTRKGSAVGGGHAGYRVYACRDGRVALAALEPHFADALCAVAGLAGAGQQRMFLPATHASVAAWLAGKTRRQLAGIAAAHDIPLHTMA